MKKLLLAIAFMSLLAVIMLGCKAEVEDERNSVDQLGSSEISGEDSDSDNIAGDVAAIGVLDSDLNDPELDQTEDFLDELDW